MDEKTLTGDDIYNKKVYQPPLTDTIPFVDTGLGIHNVNNLIVAIKKKMRLLIIVYRISPIRLGNFMDLQRHLIILL